MDPGLCGRAARYLLDPDVIEVVIAPKTEAIIPSGLLAKWPTGEPTPACEYFMELQRQLWQDIEQLERNRTMPYLTSVERIGIEKGMQQGMQQEACNLLKRQLNRRFGPLPEVARARLENAALDQLEQWADHLLDAKSLEDVFASH